MIPSQFKHLCLLVLAPAVALIGCRNRSDSATEDGASRAHSPAATLVEKAVSSPGMDLWLGDESLAVERIPMIEKFSLYAIHHDRFAVSGEQLQQLRGQRDAVIAALRPRIATAGTAALEVPGADVAVPSLETELTIALDLNAVELLSLLTGTAMQLQTHLQNFESGKLDTYLATPHARLHRNLLGAISGILRQEAFGPVVNEEWDSYFTFDPAHADSGVNLLEGAHFTDAPVPEIPIGGFAPFTSEFSQQLIDWSRTYLEETPEPRRKGAAGMEVPVPVMR